MRRISGSMFAVFVLVLGLATAVPAQEAQESLTIGDPAPPLAVSKWVKGGPIESFQNDKVYVVEFWATWCGPCRTSIPHLTDLQKEYKDKGVEIIGVSISESDPAQVEPFVEEMGDKMDYHVAKDLIPDDGDASDGKMSTAWMQAAGEGGIPTAFVIQNGKVAWIGHPMSMDKPLDEIVSGEYDLAAAAAEREKEKAVERKMMAMRGELVAALRANDQAKALEIIENAIHEDPAMELQLGFMKLNLLQQAGKAQAFVEYGNHLVDEVFNESPQMLNQVAWTLVDPRRGDDVDEGTAKVALAAAEKAADLAGEDWMILDTLARAQFVAGEKAKALETQRKVVELAGDDADEEIKGRLEQYEKAVEKN